MHPRKTLQPGPDRVSAGSRSCALDIPARELLEQIAKEQDQLKRKLRVEEESHAFAKQAVSTN
jgi:hypothetical protein